MIACYKSDDLWGVIPGCNEYAGYVTYRVRVDQPSFWTEKTVSKSGEGNFVQITDANPGDLLDFKIYYKNTGTTNQIDVVAHDIIPKGMTYVSGSVKVTTPAGTVTLTPSQEEKLFNGDDKNALIIGDYYPGEEATITYQVKLSSEDEFDCGETALQNDVTIQTANGSEYDRVKVKVNKTCSKDEPTPSTPSELPKTGPTEIALLVVIVLVIGGGGFYFYKSSRMLKKVSAGVAPDAPETPEQTSVTTTETAAADSAEKKADDSSSPESSQAVIEGIQNDSSKQKQVFLRERSPWKRGPLGKMTKV